MMLHGHIAFAWRQIRVYERSIPGRKDKATRKAHPKMFFWQGRRVNFAEAARQIAWTASAPTLSPT